MPEPLYALKRDLDMLTDDVQTLKTSYNLLDYIAKVVRNVEIEQLAQAAQMGRMEKDIAEMKSEIAEMKGEIVEIKETLMLIKKHLKIP